MRSELFDKIRRLTLLLMISGAMNILMVAFLSFYYFKERPPTPICEKMPDYSKKASGAIVIESSNSDLLRNYQSLSIGDLIEKLYDNRLASDGFTHRDLALGYLLTNNHFDIVKALKGETFPSQKRTIAYRDNRQSLCKITTFSDLNDKHYEKIIAFAKTEQWPLTPEGLFLTLQTQIEEKNKNLKYAFYLTPEFLAVDLLFKRGTQETPRGELLDVLLEGTWQELSAFTEKQRIAQDLSQEQRRQFLLGYIKQGSITAANLILKIDPYFTTKKLDDDQVLAILQHLTKRTPEAARFALEILASPRRDAVWQEAADRLYSFVGEEKPKEYSKNSVLARFLPLAVRQQEKAPIKRVDKIIAYNLEEKKQPQKNPTPPPQKKEKEKWKRAYTAKNGDSLWKIGRMFNVDVEELKKHNKLTSDTLAPGTMIIVP